MNLNNLQSSHGIQYNIRFWRFFQFSHRKIFTCLQHSENDTKRQRDISSTNSSTSETWWTAWLSTGKRQIINKMNRRFILQSKSVVRILLPNRITEWAFLPLYGLRRGIIWLRRNSAKTNRLNFWPGSSTLIAKYPWYQMTDITVMRRLFVLILLTSSPLPFRRIGIFSW